MRKEDDGTKGETEFGWAQPDAAPGTTAKRRGRDFGVPGRLRGVRIR